MKKEKRDQSRQLRQQGHSINEIVLKLGVTKSSVSVWTRDIELTSKQKQRLSLKGRTLEAIENRRKARLTNEKLRRSVFFNAARDSIISLSKKDLLYLGMGLYWGEGSKTNRGSVSFYNGDPRLIQIMVRFYREICGVPSSKFRGHVLLHHHLNARRAEQYWSKVSGVPRSQFHKTSMQHNKKSKNLKDTLPYGTFALCVYDTELFLKIMGWMEGTYEYIVPKKERIMSPNRACL